jgi:hypothetical protein
MNRTTTRTVDVESCANLKGPDQVLLPLPQLNATSGAFELGKPSEVFSVVGNGARSLEKLLNDGWNYHDKESEHLARELDAAAQEGAAPGLLASFLHLSAHTISDEMQWAYSRTTILPFA